MKRRTVLKSIAFVAAAVNFRAALAQSSPEVFRWATTATITTPDPYYNYFREAVTLNGNLIWDTLIYRDPDDGKYRPLLAKSWTWIDDLTLDVVLREGVKWHDGEAFTADDVVYTINYVTDPSKKVNVQSNVNWMKGAEKTGDLSVRIRLKAPFPPAIEYLAGQVPIMPKDFYGDTARAAANGRLVGTGPYKIAKFTPASAYELDVFDGYYSDSPKGRGRIKKIVCRIIPDFATQMAELLSGGLDWVWYVPFDQMARLKASPRLTAQSADAMRFTYLHFNTQKMNVANPLSDKRVRDAITYAIDRQAIIDNIVGGGSTLKRSGCYETQFGCTTDVRQFAYDPDRAKKLLAEAGFSKGLTLELGAYRSKDQAEAIASFLEPVGIKVNINFQEYNAIHARFIENKAIHMFLADWGSYSINDVSVILNNFYQLSPEDVSKDKELSGWVAEAAQTVDQDRRKILYDKAFKRIADETYWLPLWSNPVNYAYDKHFVFTPYADENPRFFLAKWS